MNKRALLTLFGLVLLTVLLALAAFGPHGTGRVSSPSAPVPMERLATGGARLLSQSAPAPLTVRGDPVPDAQSSPITGRSTMEALGHLPGPAPWPSSQREVAYPEKVLPVPVNWKDGAGRIALVIDDFGYSLAVARQIAGLGGPSHSFTWAIMPDCPYSAACARLARSVEQPYIVHLPMQAISDPNGQGYLIGVDTPNDRIEAQVARMARLFPGALGINNHRGSKATSNLRTMQAFGQAMAGRGWGFLDSRTSSCSVARATVASYGVPSLSNMAFIDGQEDLSYMKGQFARVLRMARKRGLAVAICHARSGTLPFLRWIVNQNFGDLHFVSLDQLWFPNGEMRRNEQ